MSGVEDELQEDVAECIKDFQEAGIHFWMLTGDKGETAEEIGYSCGLFARENFTVHKVEENEMDSVYNKLHEVSKIEDGNYGFMIGGNMLPLIFGSKDESTLFLKIIKKAKAIIVYRSSPAQKADIVNFVRRKLKNAITLAIGDGANDVCMIQSAHVGIGLFGKEGNQAATFADIAVPQFKNLRRLLFWHGRSFLLRLINYANWFLFKSALFATCTLYYNSFNGYFGLAAFEDTYYSGFNFYLTNLVPYIFLLRD